MKEIRLTEWETARPDTHDVLAKQSLAGYPNDRALARKLAALKRLEVFELADGLEIRARSFIGRIVLGDLTVTIQQKIPDAPLLGLVRYAYGLQQLSLYDEVGYSTTSWNIQDLLIEQLAAEAAKLLERGIQRDYERVQEPLSNPRGKVDFSRYASAMAHAETTLPCVHYPRTQNTVLNQALSAGLIFAAAITSNTGLRARVKRFARMFETKFAAPLSHAAIEQARLKIDRRTLNYKPAIRLVELLLDGQGLDLGSGTGEVPLKGFLFDMNRFFQALISRFLREHLPAVTLHDEHRLKGVFQYLQTDHPKLRRAPALRPDFAVMQEGRILAVLDAKYRDLWETGLPRDMLYQLSMYALGHTGSQRQSAIIYPTTNASARERTIVIRDPVRGTPRAQVVLRPVNLLALEQVLTRGLPDKEKRIKLANALAFG